MLGALLGIAGAAGLASMLWNSATCPSCEAGSSLIDSEEWYQPPPIDPVAPAWGCGSLVLGGLSAVTCLAAGPDAIFLGIFAGVAVVFVGSMIGAAQDRAAEAERLAQFRYTPNRCQRCGYEWGEGLPVSIDILTREHEDAKDFIERDSYQQALRHLYRIQRLLEAHRFPPDAEWNGELQLLTGLCLLHLEDHHSARGYLESALKLLPSGKQRDEAKKALCYLEGEISQEEIKVNWRKFRKDLVEHSISGIAKAVKAVTGNKDPRYVRRDGSEERFRVVSRTAKG